LPHDAIVEKKVCASAKRPITVAFTLRQRCDDRKSETNEQRQMFTTCHSQTAK